MHRARSRRGDRVPGATDGRDVGRHQSAHGQRRDPRQATPASQVVRYLDGITYVAFGSVTPAGEPSVSPLDSVFVRALHSFKPTAPQGVSPICATNPACSLVHMVGDTVAIVVHGRTEWIHRSHADHDEIHSIWISAYDSDPYSWGNEIVLFRAEPAAMWALRATPQRLPG